jgi:hypothetical protein
VRLHDQWHWPVPESVKLAPATGMNFHEYALLESVSFKTP